MNIHVDTWFHFSQVYTRSRIAGSQGNLRFKHLRNYKTSLHSGFPAASGTRLVVRGTGLGRRSNDKVYVDCLFSEKKMIIKYS